MYIQIKSHFGRYEPPIDAELWVKAIPTYPQCCLQYLSNSALLYHIDTKNGRASLQSLEAGRCFVRSNSFKTTG